MTTLARLDDKIQVFTEYTNIERCRGVPCGKWNKAASCWEYPLDSILDIMAAFPHATLDKNLDILRKRELSLRDTVLNLKNDKVAVREHPFLMHHQRKCRDIAAYMRKFALYLDTGTGKTIAAYSIISDRLADKWLVISPKSIIKTAWMDDHLQFFPDLKVLPLSKNMSKVDYVAIADRWGLPHAKKLRAAQLPEYLIVYADVVVINPEAYKTNTLIANWDNRGIIIDESSILRNMKTQTTESLIKYCDTMLYAYLLSGKPAPNTDLEYFPQMRIVNHTLFGDSFYKFRDTYFEATDYFGKDFKMRPERADMFADRLSKGCIFISKAECLDLPPEMPPIIRSIELSPDALKYYKQMERESVLVLQDKDVAAPTKLAASMKLRQITSGFIIDTDNGKEISKLHSNKIGELADVVTELGDNKAVIWINFKQEVADIAAMLDSMGKTYCTAYSGTKDTDASISAFKDNTAQFIIAHPKTLKYGVTFTGASMVKNCTYAIYYSMSYSFEDYYQSHDRIYRKGQTESCSFIFLVAEKTIDVDIYDAILNKGSNAAIMENMIRRCTKENG